MMTESLVFIGLGANLGDAGHTLELAKNAILNIDNVRLFSCSSFYRSRPLDKRSSPDYCNAVLGVYTHLSPVSMLQRLQEIELDFGRQRSDDRWASRTLDLDILLIDDIVIDLPDLCVPHYDMHNRDFVLFPLLEIAPDSVIPGKGSVDSFAQRLDSDLRHW